MTRPVLSVVFPCHNEAPHIARLLRDADAALAGIDHELIVVADGCTDGTQDAVLAAMDDLPSARLIDNERRMGKGGAIRTGVMDARGDHVAFMDGDGEIDPSFLREALDVLRGGTADIAVGNRYAPGGSYHTTFGRHVTSRTYQTVIWLLFGLDLHDTQAGLKAFTADAARALFAASNVDGYAFDIDVLTHAHWMGYRIKEIPIKQRFKGTSTISFKHVLEMVADTCGTYDRHARGLRAAGPSRGGLLAILRSYAFYPFTETLETALRALMRRMR
jgi:glycosyltransferase involved in cell wall biosynthesis